jgi:hypothetical protein
LDVTSGESARSGYGYLVVLRKRVSRETALFDRLRANVFHVKQRCSTIRSTR